MNTRCSFLTLKNYFWNLMIPSWEFFWSISSSARFRFLDSLHSNYMMWAVTAASGGTSTCRSPTTSMQHRSRPHPARLSYCRRMVPWVSSGWYPLVNRLTAYGVSRRVIRSQDLLTMYYHCQLIFALMNIQNTLHKLTKYIFVGISIHCTVSILWLYFQVFRLA